MFEKAELLMVSVPWLRMPPPLWPPPPLSVRPLIVTVTPAGTENKPKPPSPWIVRSEAPGPTMFTGSVVFESTSVPSASEMLIVWGVPKTVGSKRIVLTPDAPSRIAVGPGRRPTAACPQTVESPVLVTR